MEKTPFTYAAYLAFPHLACRFEADLGIDLGSIWGSIWGRFGVGWCPGRPGKPLLKGIEILIEKCPKLAFGSTIPMVFATTRAPDFEPIEGKRGGHKSHFGQNPLGICMIFGQQHASIMREVQTAAAKRAK